VRTPNVEVDGTNLREEFLRFHSLPIPDPANEDHIFNLRNYLLMKRRSLYLQRRSMRRIDEAKDEG